MSFFGTSQYTATTTSASSASPNPFDDFGHEEDEVDETFTTLTLLQTLSPDAMRGRVMSLQTALFLGTLGIGAPLAGAIADSVGPSVVLTAGGAITALAMLGIGRPLLRALAQHPEYAAAHSAQVASRR